jgi:hypothetical protein
MATPSTLGPFTLDRLVGRDAVAATWAACYVASSDHAQSADLEPLRAGSDVTGRLNVYLHRVRPELMADPALLHAAQRRVRELTQLSHPRLVPWLASALIEEQRVHVEARPTGGLLADVLRAAWREGERLRGATLRHVAMQIAAGLEALHNHRGSGAADEPLAHRAFRPAAVHLAPDGSVRIRGYGLLPSPLILGAPSRPLPGSFPDDLFLAPEQWTEAADVGRAVDLWSLGAVLLHAATGEFPYPREQLSDPGSLPEDVPRDRLDAADEVLPGLGTVLARCLARTPARRYRNVTGALADLRNLPAVAEHVDVRAELARFVALGSALPAPPPTDASDRSGWTDRASLADADDGSSHGEPTHEVEADDPLGRSHEPRAALRALSGEAAGLPFDVAYGMSDGTFAGRAGGRRSSVPVADGSVVTAIAENARTVRFSPAAGPTSSVGSSPSTASFPTGAPVSRGTSAGERFEGTRGSTHGLTAHAATTPTQIRQGAEVNAFALWFGGIGAIGLLLYTALTAVSAFRVADGQGPGAALTPATPPAPISVQDLAAVAEPMEASPRAAAPGWTILPAAIDAQAVARQRDAETDALALAAMNGALDGATRERLRATALHAPGFLAAHALLLDDAAARQAHADRDTAMRALLSHPEARRDPVLLLHAAEIETVNLHWEQAATHAAAAARAYSALGPTRVADRDRALYREAKAKTGAATATPSPAANRAALAAWSTLAVSASDEALRVEAGRQADRFADPTTTTP